MCLWWVEKLAVAVGGGGGSHGEWVVGRGGGGRGKWTKNKGWEKVNNKTKKPS